MELPPYVYISIITTLISLGGAWAVVKFRLENSEKIDDDQWAIITKIREWQTAHERESLSIRIDYEKRIGDINSNIREVRAQHSDILRRMEAMDLKLDKLFDILRRNQMFKGGD